MTRLDVARLHHHLEGRVMAGRRVLARCTGDAPNVGHRVDTYVDALRWLRTQAARQSAARPRDFIESGQVRLELDEWLEYLDGEAERLGRIEARARTLRQLAAEAKAWEIQPDPFPDPVPTPRWRQRAAAWLTEWFTYQ